MVWSYRDLTDRRRAEETRHRLEEQLFHAQKMEALGTLAGGIAHDFNNILTAIMSYTELAAQDAGEHSEAREHLGYVLQASHRARDLVSQILTFSRSMPQHRTPVRLGQVVTDALALLRSTLPPSIEVVADCAQDETPVLADAAQIHQVVMNLCVNAAHAMEPLGGRLTVRLAPVEIPPAGTPATAGLGPGRYLLLSVKDTGVGMDATTAARVFEPFFSTREPGRGTGLGLAVVHAIVRNHGGTVAVESRLGAGSSFRVFLPVLVDQAPPSPVPIAALEPPRAGGEHVLLVDDEPAILSAARHLLQRLGYQVTALTDGSAAVAAVRERAGEFDIVVTDLRMPGMTGVEVARAVGEVAPGLPVVLVTGFNQGWTGERAREVGIRAVVEKPFTATRLGSVISEVLRGSAALIR